MSRLEELIQEYCPNGVEYRRIQEFCSVNRGRVMSKEYLRDNSGNYPVYSSQTENNGIFGYINTYDFDFESITWTTDGARAGSVFYHSEEKFSITNVCGLIRVIDENISTRFLYYLLEIHAKDYVSSGMGNPKLMSNVMNRISLPLPPLPVQEEIVRILDKFTALEAELEAELEARKKQYEYYRSHLLTLSDDTPSVQLDKIADFKYGFTDIAKEIGTARFIRITDIGSNGKLVPNDCKYVDLNSDSEGYLLEKGDILMARTGATYGKTMLFDEDYPAVYASFLIRIRFAENTILPAYYWHFAQSDLYWIQANKLVSKAGQPQFNANVLKNVNIPVPPISEQRRIIALLDRFDTLVNDITQGLPAEIEARRKQYEYYRNQLLTFKEATP